MSQQQYPHVVTNSTSAVISLIAGIAGWTILPLLGSVVAVITGHMAKKEIRQSGGMLGGEGLATAGLILGYASLALGLVGGCIAILVFVFGLTIPFCTLGANSNYSFLLAPLFGF